MNISPHRILAAALLLTVCPVLAADEDDAAKQIADVPLPAAASDQRVAADDSGTGTGAAETGTGTAEMVLSIEAAVGQALATHPDLQSAAAAVRREQHLVCQVTRPPNPTVGYTASEVGNDGEAGQQGVFLNQNFVRGGKLYLNGQVQQRAVSIAWHRMQLTKWRLEADVRTTFVDAAFAQERRKLLQRLQSSLDTASQSAKRLLESGIISGSSYSQAQLEAQKNQMQIQRTETQLNYATARLAALIGAVDDIPSVKAAALLPGEPPAEMDVLWQDVLSRSPELALAASRYDRSQWQVRREIAEPIPNLQTQWSVQQDASTNHTVVGVQLGVTLPVRNDNSGAINAARADTWRTHYDAQAVQRSLRQRLAATYGELQQADDQLRMINTELESLARHTLQKTQQAFSLGEATYLDLLNAQRAYISLRLDTLDLYRQRAVADIHLHTLLVRAELGDVP